MTQYSFNVNGQSAVGNLTRNANGTLQKLAITDPFNSQDNQTCTNAYDDLSRLTNNSCGSVWAQTFTYDAFGNISKSGSSAWQPNYNHPANQYQSGWNGVSYDNDGELLADPYNTYTWSVYGDLASVNGATVVYDAFGRMVENLNGTRQFVYSPVSQQPLAVMQGTTVNYASVHMPGNSYAVYANSGLWLYSHGDWLESTRLLSSPTRTAIPAMAYAPFGEGYSGGSTGWLHFAGADASTVFDSNNQTGSLNDFTFRRYSPGQGRWISPDPAGLGAVDPSNPQSWNRYAYVLNNPLGGTDPLGLECVWDDGSFDSADDPDTGGDGSGCTKQGGSWVPPDLFENATLTTGQWNSNYGDWSSTPNAALAQNWNISSATASTTAPDPNSIASSLNNSLSYARNFGRSFFTGFSLNAVYKSFRDPDGCDNLMATTFADVFNPLPGDGLGPSDAAELGPQALAQAGRTAASAYSLYQGLSVPLRSSIYRGLQSSTYGLAATAEEAAPYLQVGYAGGKALTITSMAAYNGECH